MSPPEPFTISVPEAALDKLKRKLADTNYPDELDADDQWQYGALLADVKRLAKHWENDFNWRKTEAKLNELPNYQKKVDVDGFGEIDVHFVWQKSGKEGAIPVLFCHGSKSQKKSILTTNHNRASQSHDNDDNNQPTFDIIAPSLPNFGFSQRISKPGFALTQYAQTLHRLMQDLGYAQYVTQGGDWGFYITRIMGLLYPENVLASHINMVRANPPSFTSDPLAALRHAVTPYTEKEKRGLERSEWFFNEGQAYRQLQDTKPQTVSFATAGPNAHVRIYYEATHHPTEKVPGRERASGWIGGVKLGVAHFPKELSVVPRVWARTLGPLVYESDNDRGGHFAAWERPDVIAGDLVKMFGKGGLAVVLCLVEVGINLLFCGDSA
ncbi:alpha/beta-hydrolase [Byssothecium circinans]|uniref:Alpha/beta-hydrolase n=1 Tax=Byssothecium circinans TaxID=147558 RepID=A0A6A5U4V9_9PLEO|nr:alpha/beta-hydrolase [Byssothecium circinans]